MWGTGTNSISCLFQTSSNETAQRVSWSSEQRKRLERIKCKWKNNHCTKYCVRCVALTQHCSKRLFWERENPNMAVSRECCSAGLHCNVIDTLGFSGRAKCSLKTQFLWAPSTTNRRRWSNEDRKKQLFHINTAPNLIRRDAKCTNTRWLDQQDKRIESVSCRCHWIRALKSGCCLFDSIGGRKWLHAPKITYGEADSVCSSVFFHRKFPVC